MNLTFTEELPPGAIPIYVDASLMKKSGCQLAFSLTLKGLRKIIDDPILTLGKAVHKFAEVAWENDLQALAAGRDVMVDAKLDAAEFISVASARPSGVIPKPLVVNGRAGTEFYFETPWLTFVYKSITYVIIICGTIDHVSFVNGVMRLYDYKTTRYYKIGDALSKYKYEMQFTFYAWALWKFGHKFFDLDIHNAIRDLKLTFSVVVIQIKTKPPKWTISSPQGFIQSDLENFENELRKSLVTNLLPYLDGESSRNGMISNACAQCNFAELCYAAPGMEDALIASLYTQKQYTPKSHT
jgi:hypothetical protein